MPEVEHKASHQGSDEEACHSGGLELAEHFSVLFFGDEFADQGAEGGVYGTGAESVEGGGDEEPKESGGVLGKDSGEGVEGETEALEDVGGAEEGGFTEALCYPAEKEGAHEDSEDGFIGKDDSEFAGVVAEH